MKRRPVPNNTRVGPSRFWLIIAFLIGINVLVYAPLGHYGFVNYDDPQYVSDNPQVATGPRGANVLWAFATGHEANWHPLTWLSHMVDVQLFGLNAGGHHLTNVAFHIANTLLLFWVLFQMTGALGRSTFVAALFAVHPLHVQSVAWIAERKDVLSAFFWMLTLCAYSFYVRQPRAARYVAMVALFAAGLMAKPMLVTLPFVLLLLDFWPLGRMTFRPNSNLPKLIGEKIPLFILTAISSIVTFIVQQRGGAMAGVETIPMYSRIANACIAYFSYAWKMFWPTRLAVLYPAGAAVPGWWWIAALGLLAASGLSIWAARRWRYIAVGWFWYLGTLVPVIGLVQVGRQAMADRYTYIPLVGLFLILAFGLTDALSWWKPRRPVLMLAGGTAVAACMWLASIQLRNWSNSKVLWEHTLAITAENALAHFNLGAALESNGDLNDAIYHYSEAIRIEPQYADAHCNLGNALMKSGNNSRLDEAKGHLTAALEINPRFPEAHNALGIHSMLQGKFSEAITHFSEALRLKPDFPLAHNNLGTALGNEGRFEEAITEYTQAARLDPGYAEAHNNLGIVLAKVGKPNEAIAQFSEALRINPDNAVARDWLVHLKGGNVPSR